MRAQARNGLATAEYLAIGERGADQLEAIMRRGEPPDVKALAGWEYRGMNVAFWAGVLPIKKFIKGFYEDDAGRVYGYNEPLVQNPLGEPWIAKPSDAQPKRFGFFLVTPPDASARDNTYLNSVLLDYSRGGNPIVDPSRGLRDYVVRIDKGSDERLLGKAFYALGPLRLTFSYFVLERHRPTDFRR